METKLNGPITKYINLVGINVDQAQETVASITNGLAVDPVIHTTDPSFLAADSSESYWLYYNAGLELHWRDDVLTDLSLHIQDDNFHKAPYVPLSYQLLTSLPNTATIQEVVSTFGTPEFLGGLWGRKNLRYRADEEKYVAFCFDDKGRLWSVKLGLYRALRG